jgi:prevent-host-death family protein
MKQVAAAKFKEQCLALLDEVDEKGIVITKCGKPVAKLIPFVPGPLHRGIQDAAPKAPLLWREGSTVVYPVIDPDRPHTP